MFSSSARRAFLKVPASPTAATFAASAPKVAASQYRLQRRYSSSKPSSPANGSKGVPDGQPAPTPSRSNQRKAKEVADECTVKGRDKTMQNLPSVPSTMHLNSKDVTMSDFFSLHRPISVTEVVPQTVSNEMFGAIFTKPSTEAKTGAVIGTLSRTIEELNKSVLDQIPFEKSLQHGFSQEAHQNSAAPSNVDQPLIFSIPFPQPIMNSKFMPFNPPPPPVPMNDAQYLSTFEEFHEEQPLAQPKKYHALITVEESKDENGKVLYTSYASDFIPEETAQIAPPTFLERMRLRQKRYEDSLGPRWRENRMWAISVKRQRKLKMKKHKYKKLMRKTRNERRRLDRT